MSDSAVLVFAIAATWLAIGLVLSVVMGRRGHNGFGWLVIGAVVGPLAVVLALAARRHEVDAQRDGRSGGSQGPGRPGRVDVLVGYDGSPQSIAALDAARALFGDRMGRLGVATVTHFGDSRQQERAARAALDRLTAGAPGPRPHLEVLHGHPATALVTFARSAGYDVIAVGTRGSGITKAILGSAASELARDSRVPVLLVAGTATASGPGQRVTSVATVL